MRYEEYQSSQERVSVVVAGGLLTVTGTVVGGDGTMIHFQTDDGERIDVAKGQIVYLKHNPPEGK